MSYILDALKKSEQERGHGAAPNVQTLHSSSLNYHANKTQLWPYFLLAAIVINLAALFYFIIAKTEVEATTQEQQRITETNPAVSNTTQTARSKPAARAIEGVYSAEAVVYQPISMPDTKQGIAKQAPRARVVEAPRHQQASLSVLERDELPFDMQQHIPVMEFSAHVYSSNPLQRSAVINGRFMEEGDWLASDLFLSEITPDGAIFDFQGQLFHQGVVSAWN
ncbi:MAG: general secretion pathway protein GspB [Arenicellales bacterium]